MLTAFEAVRLERGWKWSSTRTNLGTLLGALRRSAKSAWLTCAEIRDYCKAVDRNVIAERPDYPKPLVAAHAVALLKKLRRSTPSLAVFLALQWSCSSRPHCTALLAPQDVTIDVQAQTATLLFTRGKGAWSRRAPYAVHTSLGFMTPVVETYLRSRMPHTTLFPAEGREYEALKRDLRNALRSMDASYRLGSIRRGALEKLAETGADAETLKFFSGHKTMASLLRYLRWGRRYRRLRQKMTRVALNLW